MDVRVCQRSPPAWCRWKARLKTTLAGVDRGRSSGDGPFNRHSAETETTRGMIRPRQRGRRVGAVLARPRFVNVSPRSYQTLSPPTRGRWGASFANAERLATGLVPVEGPFDNYRGRRGPWAVERRWSVQSALGRDRNNPRYDSASATWRRVRDVLARPRFVSVSPGSCQTPEPPTRGRWGV